MGYTYQMEGLDDNILLDILGRLQEDEVLGLITSSIHVKRRALVHAWIGYRYCNEETDDIDKEKLPLYGTLIRCFKPSPRYSSDGGYVPRYHCIWNFMLGHERLFGNIEKAVRATSLYRKNMIFNSIVDERTGTFSLYTRAYDQSRPCTRDPFLHVRSQTYNEKTTALRIDADMYMWRIIYSCCLCKACGNGPSIAKYILLRYT